MTKHLPPSGGKCVCFHSAHTIVKTPGTNVEYVDVVVVVAERTYLHLPTYDDPLVTDNDDSCCGYVIRYTKPDEVIVTSVGDVP